MQINFYPLKFNTEQVCGSLIEYQERVNRNGSNEYNIHDLRNTQKGKYLFTR